MRILVKQLLNALPPEISIHISNFLRRSVASNASRKQSREINGIVTKLGTITVMSGPFAGMLYPYLANAQGGYLPKLLGTYELELHDTWRMLSKKSFKQIIDVGAAEGYYVAGLSISFPSAIVHAFESERPLHAAIKKTAKLNRLEGRVELYGKCTCAKLSGLLSQADVARATLLVLDCEGAEDYLLDPELVPGLREVTIVVEVHDGLVLQVGDRIANRFWDTHNITIVNTRPRRMADAPLQCKLTKMHAEIALSEGRSGPMRWFVMDPKSSS